MRKKSMFPLWTVVYFLVLIIVAVGSYYLGTLQIKQPPTVTTNQNRQTGICMPYAFPTRESRGVYASSPTPPIHVYLEPLTLAPLGKPMRLCLTVVSTVDAPNTTVSFTLPEDASVITGQTERTLILPENIPKVFEIEILFRTPGIKLIDAVAQSVQNGLTWGNSARLVLDVSETETVVREDPPPSEIEGDQETMPLISVNPQLVQNRCLLKPDPGPCKAMFPSWYFDATDQICEEFVWGGCDGVRPFATAEECQMYCLR